MVKCRRKSEKGEKHLHLSSFVEQNGEIICFSCALFMPKQTLNTSHELGSVAALTKKDTEKNQTHLTIIKVMNI